MAHLSDKQQTENNKRFNDSSVRKNKTVMRGWNPVLVVDLDAVLMFPQGQNVLFCLILGLLTLTAFQDSWHWR